MSARGAVLFDFNGVLVDDEIFHWRAFREVVAPLGVRLGRVRYNRRYLVYDDRRALEAILRDVPRLEPRPAIEALVARKGRIYRRLSRAVVIEPRVRRLVRDMARLAPIGVVSSASRREVAAALRRAGLTRLFGTIVTAEDVKRSKPWPDGYRLALRRLGLSRGRGSVAIEDSPGGVRAARAAGLAVIGVATTFKPAVLRRAGARRVAARLSALRADRVMEHVVSAGRSGSLAASRKRPSRRPSSKRSRRPGSTRRGST